MSDSEEKYDRACRLNADGASAIAREEKLLTLLSMQNADGNPSRLLSDEREKNPFE